MATLSPVRNGPGGAKTAGYPLLSEQLWELGDGRPGRHARRTVVYRLAHLEPPRVSHWADEAVRRHDALRIVLGHDGDGLVQRFAEEPPTASPALEDFGETEPPEHVARRLARATEADGGCGAALTVAAARAGAGAGGYVALGVHRALVDDVSFAQLRESFVRACGPGGADASADPAGSFEEYVRAVTSGSRPARVQRNTEWWVARLREVDPVPARGLLPPRERYALDDLAYSRIATPPLGLLRRAADRRKVTVPAVLLAASARALAELARLRRLQVLVPATPGRTQGRARTVGNFVLPLPLALDLRGSAEGDVQQAADAMFQGLLRSPYSFPVWSSAFRAHVAGAPRPPLIVAFLYEEAEGAADRTPSSGAAIAGGLPVERLPESRPVVVPADYLEFRYFHESSATVSGGVNYSRSSYQPGFVEQLGRAVSARIEEICAS